MILCTKAQRGNDSHICVLCVPPVFRRNCDRIGNSLEWRMKSPENEALTRRIAELERQLAETRKQMETLEIEKSRLREFIEYMPHPVFEVDCAGHILYGNEKIFNLFGYTHADGEAGLNVFDHIAPDEREYALDSFRRVLQGTQSGGGDYMVMHRDGSLFPVSIYSVPFFIDGELRGMRGFIIDITTRRKIEAALRENENKFRKLLELLPDAVYEMRLFRTDVTPDERERILALVEEIQKAPEAEKKKAAILAGGELMKYMDGEMLFLNKTAERILGYPEGCYGRITLRDIVPPELYEKTALITMGIFTRNIHRDMEFQVLDKSGNLFWVSINAHLIDGEYPFIIEGVARDITRQREMELALRESEQRYRLIFDTVPVSIWEVEFGDAIPFVNSLGIVGDADFEAHLEANPSIVQEILSHIRFTNVNKETLRMYGAESKEQMLEKYNLDQANRLLYYRGAISSYLRGDETCTIESDDLTLDGRVINTINRLFFPKNTGDNTRALISVTDITPIKYAERALRESERRYRLIFDTVPVSIWEYDLSELIQEIETLRAIGVRGDQRIFEDNDESLREIISRVRLVDVNPETLRLYGAESKEDIFGSYRMKHTSEAIEVYRGALKAFLNGENHFTSEAANETLDGRRIDVLIQMTLPADPEFSGRVLLTATDITARKEAERALRESELKYRSILEHTAEGITVVNETGDIVEWNEGAEKLTGISRVKAIGRKIWNVQHEVNEEGNQTPQRLEYLQRTTEEALRTGKGSWVGQTMDYLLHREDGETRYIQQTASAIPIGQSFILVSTICDITERKRLEEERLKTDKLESVGLLAGGIAHDFNNILVSILGNISLAKLCTDDDELLGILSDAETASFRARDLTYQLLTFSKGGAPVKAVASMAEIIRESTGFCLRGANVRCEYILPEDLWPVEVDRGQINQVMNNLILNAVQAMPGGGTITVGGANIELGESSGLPLAKGRYVEICVRDQGMGISQENLSRLFDPYFTTKKTGTGLGLATTWSIVRNHGGHILVESKEGRGTVFTFYLPASENRPGPKQPALSRNRDYSGRILVMDDEPSVCDVLTHLLHHLGHTTETCSDGHEALIRYRKAREEGRPFNAVIMDLTIPGGMGGKEAIRELLKYDPDARVIVSSGYSNERIASDFREHGFRAILAKPYHLEELHAALDQVMD